MKWDISRGSFGLVRCGEQGVGSCGLLVRKIDDPTGQYLLSAAHVLSTLPWSEMVDGASVHGVSDLDGNDAVAVATLCNVTSFNTASAAQGDAAVAKLTVKNMSGDVGPIIPKGVSGFISEDIGVRMYSAAQGKLCEGTVKKVRQKGALDYFAPDGRRVPINFSDYVICDYQSMPGDSGSPVFNVLNHVVGIHIWGDQNKSESIFLPVKPLMDFFRLELWSDETRGGLNNVMARTLWGEARGENEVGMSAVASVIMNRVSKGGWWGDSIDKVCLKKFQFSCWNQNDPNASKLLSLNGVDPIFPTCLKIEKNALTSGCSSTSRVSDDCGISLSPKASFSRSNCHSGASNRALPFLRCSRSCSNSSMPSSSTLARVCSIDEIASRRALQSRLSTRNV
jgi:hypothetical protein